MSGKFLVQYPRRGRLHQRLFNGCHTFFISALIAIAPDSNVLRAPRDDECRAQSSWKLFLYSALLAASLVFKQRPRSALASAAFAALAAAQTVCLDARNFSAPDHIA
jgi:hypothetical protein